MQSSNDMIHFKYCLYFTHLMLEEDMLFTENLLHTARLFLGAWIVNVVPYRQFGT